MTKGTRGAETTGADVADPRVSDWELVARARRERGAGAGGAGEPFAVLFRRHGPVVYSFLLRFTGNAALAEDLTQETFLAAYRHLDDFRPSRAHAGQAATLRPWLCRVAHNLAVSHLRRRSSGEVPSGGGTPWAVPPDCPEEAAMYHEELAEVRRAVTALPPAYREPVLLYYSAELSYAEIASVLSLPVGTVATRLRRALARLARELGTPGRDAGPEVAPARKRTGVGRPDSTAEPSGGA